MRAQGLWPIWAVQCWWRAGAAWPGATAKRVGDTDSTLIGTLGELTSQIRQVQCGLKRVKGEIQHVVFC